MKNASVCLLLLGLLQGGAAAHDFYPRECCSDADCAPLAASRVQVTPQGYLVDNRETVPHGKARWSPDEQYHGCFPPATGKMGCFWAPQKGL